MRRSRRSLRSGLALIGGLLLVAVVATVAMWATAPRPAVDLGAWRVIVLQSDDWGLEGWFPDAEAARALSDLAEDLPPRLRAYARGGLETAEDVDAVAAVLASRTDADGLPLVLQANHILAGPWIAPGPDAMPPASDAAGVEGADGATEWPLHPSGSGEGRYARPGLDAAVDRAIARGVWWPELHGLTHFDLAAYAAAWHGDDPLARRAAAHGTLAYEGWLRHSELDGADADRARRLVEAATTRFERRFGRPPVSVIAPDYRWGPEDERAWIAEGLRVVQAKREQVDRTQRPHTHLGRLRKWWRQRWEERAGALHYLDRPARLEPYGDPDPRTEQGALEAAEAVRRAWDEGLPGIISVHRIQLVAFDEAVATAGRRQLLACVDELLGDGPVRCLVDTEVEQLQRRGWSILERGPWVVVRNWTDDVVELPWGNERRRFEVGTHVLDRAGSPASR